MKKIITTVLALFTVAVVSAQTTVKLNVKHLLKDKDFALNLATENNLGNAFNVSRLEYYISKISIIHDGGKTTEATGVYILANAASDLSVDLGSYNVTKIEGVKFSVGVNSPQNNQDPSQWPVGHALAPKSPSMHWGWTAGYRFVAMEGKAGSNLNTGYELHALGNDYYYTIQIPLTAQDVSGQLHINLKADYTKALENINVSGGVIVHGEGAETIKLLQNFRDHVFTSDSGAKNILASLNNEVSPNAVAIYPNPSNGSNVSVEITDNSVSYTAVQVTDITGRVVTEITASNTQPIEIVNLENGIYMVSLMNGDHRLLTKKLVIQ